MGAPPRRPPTGELALPFLPALAPLPWAASGRPSSFRTPHYDTLEYCNFDDYYSSRYNVSDRTPHVAVWTDPTPRFPQPSVPPSGGETKVARHPHSFPRDPTYHRHLPLLLSLYPALCSRHMLHEARVQCWWAGRSRTAHPTRQPVRAVVAPALWPRRAPPRRVCTTPLLQRVHLLGAPCLLLVLLLLLLLVVPVGRRLDPHLRVAARRR